MTTYPTFQLSLEDEAALAGNRRLLVAMREHVLQINRLAMSDPAQWDGPLYGPSVAADADASSHYAMGWHRSALQSLRDEYWRSTRRDWTADFEALTGMAVNGEGRFKRRPDSLDHSTIIPTPVWH